MTKLAPKYGQHTRIVLLGRTNQHLTVKGEKQHSVLAERVKEGGRSVSGNAGHLIRYFRGFIGRPPDAVRRCVWWTCGQDEGKWESRSGDS